MVKSFSIAKKPRVLFGVGLTTEAPKELKKAGCKNIFVLSDPVLKKMGAFQPLYDALDSEGLDYVICDEFDRDPTDVMVNHVASIAVEAKIDGIIGIGGGATMDIAKCVNQLIHSEFPINRYLAPDFATPTPGVPLVLIPTTPGTGSETSSALSLLQTTFRFLRRTEMWACRKSVPCSGYRFLRLWWKPHGISELHGLSHIFRHSQT